MYKQIFERLNLTLDPEPTLQNNHYITLGVKFADNEETIKERYLNFERKPIENLLNSSQNTVGKNIQEPDLKKIKEAYRILSNKSLREDYNQRLLTPLFKFKSNQNYYEILNVSSSAEPSEIKKAYKALALQWHPDKFRHTGNPITDSILLQIQCQTFKKISEANEVLSNSEYKKIYDNAEYIINNNIYNSTSEKFSERKPRRDITKKISDEIKSLLSSIIGDYFDTRGKHPTVDEVKKLACDKFRLLYPDLDIDLPSVMHARLKSLQEDKCINVYDENDKVTDVLRGRHTLVSNINSNQKKRKFEEVKTSYNEKTPEWFNNKTKVEKKYKHNVYSNTFASSSNPFWNAPSFKETFMPKTETKPSVNFTK